MLAADPFYNPALMPIHSFFRPGVAVLRSMEPGDATCRFHLAMPPILVRRIILCFVTSKSIRLCVSFRINGREFQLKSSSFVTHDVTEHPENAGCMSALIGG